MTDVILHIRVMPSTPDYNKVKARVQKVLRENNVLRPPILPREIVTNYGLSVDTVHLDSTMKDVAGFLDFGLDTIYVNSLDPFNRQTFTIAHEFGHYVLHRELFNREPDRYNVLLRRPIGAETDPIEKEANAFAAELLVPRDFLNLYSKYANVEELAELFIVSKDVIRYRLKYAGASKAF